MEYLQCSGWGTCMTDYGGDEFLLLKVGFGLDFPRLNVILVVDPHQGSHLDSALRLCYLSFPCLIMLQYTRASIQTRRPLSELPNEHARSASTPN